MQQVAVLGLGLMGQGIAKCILRAGYPLRVWNRTLERAAALAEAGAHVASTPADAVRDADVVIAMVGDDNASRAAWLGEHGAAHALQRGALAVECSTLSPGWVSELASTLAARGGRFLDSPVTGSKDAAADGRLKLLLSGAEADLAAVRPVLQVFSREIVHIGPVGAGTRWKLINNALIAVQTAALAEALVLAEAAGIEPAMVDALILSGASASPIVQTKLPVMRSGAFDDTHFALRWMAKDARYAAAMAEDFGLDLPALAGATALFERASRDEGRAVEDFCAVIEALREEPAP